MLYVTNLGTDNENGRRISPLQCRGYRKTASGQQYILTEVGTNQQILAPSITVYSKPVGHRSRTLFKIGELPAHAWAPGKSADTTAANRNLTTEPLWGPGHALLTAYNSFRCAPRVVWESENIKLSGKSRRKRYS
jgi:hypothetical protein